MNALPDSRRAIHARTHARTWSAAEMDPIERPPAVSTLERVADVLLAVFLGVMAALGLAHWFAT